MRVFGSRTPFATTRRGAEPFSPKHPAAVHQQRLPADEARVVAGEEGDGAGDVLDLAAALDRLSLEHLAPQALLVGVDLGRRGGEGAGRDRVGANALGAALSRERAREADD